MSECWNKILNSLATVVDAFDFKVWLAPITAEITDHTLSLTIRGASKYMLYRLERKMGARIRSAAAAVLNCRVEEVHLQIAGSGADSAGTGPQPQAVRTESSAAAGSFLASVPSADKEPARDETVPAGNTADRKAADADPVRTEPGQTQGRSAVTPMPSATGAAGTGASASEKHCSTHGHSEHKNQEPQSREGREPREARDLRVQVKPLASQAKSVQARNKPGAGQPAGRSQLAARPQGLLRPQPASNLPSSNLASVPGVRQPVQQGRVQGQRVMHKAIPGKDLLGRDLVDREVVKKAPADRDHGGKASAKPAAASVRSDKTPFKPLPGTEMLGTVLLRDMPIAAPVHDVPPASMTTRSADGTQTTWTMAPQPLIKTLPLDQAATISGDALLRKQWRYTFDDFVVGPTNAMAMTAAQDMCRPNSYVETLFVSSEPGLGKTHIVQSAVRQLLEERGTHAKVAYLTADDFYARFRMGLRNDTLEEFMGRVRALDFLLVDDVQYLHGKARTQEVLLSLVKHLQDRGSRVVFTSRFLPKELKSLDPQLVSLISSGILANMDAPTYGMRCEIIRRKALSQQARLPDEVIALLATSLEGDVRQIESCLQTLLLKMRVLNQGATPDMALEVLSQFSSQDKDKKPLPSFEDLMGYVSQCYGLTISQICSRIRRRNFVEARNVLFYLARKHTNMTLVQIGAKVNKRHSTVIKGIASIEHSLASATASGRQTARVVQLIERNAGYVTG